MTYLTQFEPRVPSTFSFLLEPVERQTPGPEQVLIERTYTFETIGNKLLPEDWEPLNIRTPIYTGRERGLLRRELARGVGVSHPAKVPRDPYENLLRGLSPLPKKTTKVKPKSEKDKPDAGKVYEEAQRVPERAPSVPTSVRVFKSSASSLEFAHELGTRLADPWSEPIRFTYFHHAVDCPNPESPSRSKNERACSYCHGLKRTGESAPTPVRRIWHTPSHIRDENWEKVNGEWTFNPKPEKEAFSRPLVVSDPVDAWEKFIFDANEVRWQDSLPVFYDKIHRSLVEWATKEKGNEALDQNYFASERLQVQFDPHTKNAGQGVGTTHLNRRHANAERDEEEELQYDSSRRKLALGPTETDTSEEPLSDFDFDDFNTEEVRHEWYPTNRVHVQHDLHFDCTLRKLVLAPVETFHVMKEVTQGIPNVPTSDMEGLRVAYNAAPSTLASHHELIRNGTPRKLRKSVRDFLIVDIPRIDPIVFADVKARIEPLIVDDNGEHIPEELAIGGREVSEPDRERDAKFNKDSIDEVVEVVRANILNILRSENIYTAEQLRELRELAERDDKVAASVALFKTTITGEKLTEIIPENDYERVRRAIGRLEQASHEERQAILKLAFEDAPLGEHIPGGWYAVVWLKNQPVALYLHPLTRYQPPTAVEVLAGTPAPDLEANLEAYRLGYEHRAVSRASTAEEKREAAERITEAFSRANLYWVPGTLKPAEPLVYT